jgi:hypothetical protein
MKGLGKVLVILGVFLVIYSIIGKYFIGGPEIGLGIVKSKAITGIIVANFCVVLGIAVNLWDR